MLTQREKDQIIAQSAGWLGVVLNLGCNGTGYIYQRRWRAFWIGGLLAFGCAFIGGAGGALLGSAIAQNESLSEEESIATTVTLGLIGVYLGFGGVGIGSAVEAGLRVSKIRQQLEAAEQNVNQELG
ncbi:hypothetical protein [Synechococcus elongatus]|uniref:Uncharacterized protein n=2 Tax=Synechococcus elongatus TaxID=32046 RepID=A0AAN1UUW0_SYNEL|nr:hypothetical protein [Synechococcus elongatus]AZB72995.1 hypothetical protein DOP62_09915 [Synechococcus elongatus PCC 11801]QFZ93373.1 hypothetical protein EKO22_11500 [Synechococcus elongatus PCC 11802]